MWKALIVATFLWYIIIAFITMDLNWVPVLLEADPVLRAVFLAPTVLFHVVAAIIYREWEDTE